MGARGGERAETGEEGSGVAFAVGRGSRVEDAEEGSGEVALVVESAVHGDCGDGLVALAERGAGLLDAVAVEVLDRREMEALLEVALEGAERKAALLGHLGELDFPRIVLCDIVYGAAEGGVVQGAGIAFEFSRDSSQSAYCAGLGVKRHFICNVPLDEALRGRDELDLVFDDIALFDDASIVRSIALFDIVREKVGIRPPYDFLLAIESHEVGELLIDIDEVAIRVLHEKEQSRDTIEKQLARIGDAVVGKKAR